MLAITLRWMTDPSKLDDDPNELDDDPNKLDDDYPIKLDGILK